MVVSFMIAVPFASAAPLVGGLSPRCAQLHPIDTAPGSFEDFQELIKMLPSRCQ